MQKKDDGLNLPQVLKGIPDRAEVVLIRLREIKDKIEKRMNAQDKAMNTVSPKDVVRICDGPCRVCTSAVKFS